MTWKIVKPLRIIFIALAVLIGLIGATASVETGVDLWRVRYRANDCVSGPLPGGGQIVCSPGFDGPDPPSFHSYAQQPIFAALFLLSAFGALKRRWTLLHVASWFLLPTVALEFAVQMLFSGPRVLIPGSLVEGIGLGVLLTLLLGLALVRAASVVNQSASGVDIFSSGSTADFRTRLFIVSFVAIAVAAYLWRVVTILVNFPDYEETAQATVAGIAPAVGLIVATIPLLRRSDSAMRAALAFAAGFGLPGFLGFIDFALGLGMNVRWGTATQEAVAVTACLAALALLFRGQREQIPAGGLTRV